MIARMQIRETAWNALLADWQQCVDTETCALPSEVQRLLRLGQARQIDAINMPAGFVLINAIGSRVELDALYNHFAPADRQSRWLWGFDGKADYETEYAGQHNDLLALEPDHVTYDENGQETGRQPASFENPNWVSVWAGQGDSKFIQRHARAHTRGFNEGYS